MALELINLKNTADFLKLAYDFGDDLPLKRIFLACEAAGCGSAIKETQVNDEEYSSEYEDFYKHVFSSKPPSETIRFHLFKDRLENLTTETLAKAKEGKYLGYCTLRPLKRSKICDAFIDKKVIMDEESRFVYLLCAMDKKINLGGVEFNISGFPYMQQDGRITACAQAAVRIISQYLAWKNSTSKALTGPEVTRLVRHIPSQMNQPLRTVPTSGLEVPQLRAAFESLESLDCDPIIYDYTFAKQEKIYMERADQIIYRYLESSLPVLVGINMPEARHAIVVIGHTFNPDYWMSQASSKYYKLPEPGEKQHRKGMKYHCSSSWVQNFIIQDDNLGPYHFVDASFFAFNTSCIIIPLPKRVYLRAEDAEAQGYDMVYRTSEVGGILDRALSQLEVNPQGRSNANWLKMFIASRDRYELILRTYLRKTSELLSELDKFTRTADIKQEIRNMASLPDYVWVVEISWPDIFCHMRKKCGEIIIDATASETDFFDSILAMHLPGFLYKKLIPEDSEHFKVIFEDDQPFRHFYRKKKPIPVNLPLGQFA